MQVDFRNDGDLQGTLSLKVDEKDYADNIISSLKKYQRTMSFPGFRKGKAPLGLVKKHLGSDLLKEEVNKIVVDGITDYLKEHQDELIFQPIARESTIDWDVDKDFSFEFSLALRPEFDVDVDTLKDIKTYTVVVSEEELGKEIEDLRGQYGDIEKLEESEGGDNEVMVFRAIELDEAGEEALEGGFSKMVRLDHKNYSEDFKALFKGKKSGEEVKVDISKGFDADYLAEIFEVDKNTIKDLGPHLTFNIEGAINLTPAELNEEFFAKVWHDGNEVKTEEDFRARLKSDLESRYANRETNRLTADVKKFLIDTVSIDFPETYLKEWVEKNKEDDSKDIETEIDEFRETAKWDLITNQLSKKYELSVADEEVKAAIRVRFFAEGMAYYKSQEEIEQMVEQFYGHEGYRMGVRQNILDTKITRAIQENVNLDAQEIGRTEFDKLTEESK